MENGSSRKHLQQYEPSTLYSVKARMTEFLLEPRTLSKLKELSIVRRRRGKRAGIQKRIRKTKPANFSFPYGISSNVNSIQGKFTHLEQTIANKPNVCFIALQETKIQNYGSWNDCSIAQLLVTDEALQLEQFYMFRLDREFSANGGGLITYISKEWSICCPKVCLTLSMPDIELLSVSARPRFLPNPKKSKEVVFENINVRHKGLLDIKEERTVLQGSCVERTSYTMYLGVCIDNRLTFTNHISRVLSKVYCIVSTLAYTVPCFSSETKERVFTASILPTLVYAVPVWYHFV
ncbi:hypothetical protein HOLleu_04038 [Holothuria leucospilota]|uniref:Uncharacterized protein n=1 Tax=Holothuria leucospilota TaxID=206669 RepID=A0A9Q1HM64_HOLLE|nr:hypothetical protein HOLleu_04038 [Holothuria leucospilota]